MKKLTLIFCAVLFTSGITFAQQKKSVKKTKIVAAKVQAPAAVKSTFEQRFTDVTNEKWTKTSAGHWTVSFQKENIKTLAEYDESGNWVATRSAYDAQTLPESVAGTLKTKYPAATIKDGWKIERADVAAYYKINIQDNGAEKAVLLNEAGTITE
ncbi:PepSY-like domain-containing protein [Chitinophaga nivalis]|uniref:PepSY-like domain-containing protein n=1 Tax=Chitinophaga nivalis TaxID=2991709 RepID=A0ABT3IU71_9BACT|nr:PepSY-like domain-containing protein [Chitinophaga nivalis]MCW3462776.1 PepSY-like domain-containing protein [Chitinophaga nivalis]MCW3487534.1 PepSY-like domain-containing protein [Chitinophaga nivalis]